MKWAPDGASHASIAHDLTLKPLARLPFQKRCGVLDALKTIAVWAQCTRAIDERLEARPGPLDLEDRLGRPAEDAGDRRVTLFGRWGLASMKRSSAAIFSAQKRS